ncbi:MAG: hypothetical protein ABWW69_06790 [Pyrodictiaceae archaeon]
MLSWLTSSIGSNQILRVHEASRISILVTTILFWFGLAAAAAENPVLHMAFIVGGMLSGFVAGVASSYIVSGLRGKTHRIMGLTYYILILAPIIASLSPLLALAKLEYWLIFNAISLALLVVPSVVTAQLTQGTIRLSFVGFTISHVAASIYLIVGYVTKAYIVIGIAPFLLGFLMAYPILMIYSVTINALPSTYGKKPLTLLYFISILLTLLALILLSTGYVKVSTIVLAASFIAYAFAVRMDKLATIIKEVSGLKNPIARRSHAYFIYGHAFVVGIIGVSLVESIMYLIGLLKLGCIIHMVAIGFIGLHISIHAPMMLPVILGIASARRYNYLAFVLLSTAAVLFCLAKPLSMVLVVLGVILTIMVMWPKLRG